jgi:hypothetical protein
MAKQKSRVDAGESEFLQLHGDEIIVGGRYANLLMNLVPRPGFDRKPG